MTKEIEITIKLYGAFKNLGNTTTVKAPHNTSIKELKEIIKQTLPTQEALLLQSSALSNDEEILEENYKVKSNEVISLLPPVCGG